MPHVHCCQVRAFTRDCIKSCMHVKQPQSARCLQKLHLVCTRTNRRSGCRRCGVPCAQPPPPRCHGRRGCGKCAPGVAPPAAGRPRRKRHCGRNRGAPGGAGAARTACSAAAGWCSSCDSGANACAAAQQRHRPAQLRFPVQQQRRLHRRCVRRNRCSGAFETAAVGQSSWPLPLVAPFVDVEHVKSCG